MLKEISNDINTPKIIAINRYVEMSIVFFNTLVSLMLLTAPWYIVKHDTLFEQAGQNCIISKGTVLAPFVSEPCGTAFTDLLDGGKGWSDMYNYVWVYFLLALLSSAIITYEIIKYGVREWNDANTIGFVVQLVLIIFQSIIVVQTNKLVKPGNVNASTAETLIMIALPLSAIRIIMLGFFMYITKRYNPRGFFGTGSYV